MPLGLSRCPRARLWVASLLFPVGLSAQGVPLPASDPSTDPARGGIVVMAHGGTPEWNQEVAAALRPIESRYPVELALGMADAATIEAAIQRLEGRGVTRIAVVRLFVSGESWRERTAQILGLRPGAPDRAHHPDHAAHGGTHAAAFYRVARRAAVAMSDAGLAEAEGMGLVLADRARGLSQSPAREQVLILAHGPGDDAENLRWLEWLDARAETIRQDRPYADVRVMTLREDWPEKRQEAVARIRAAVEAGTAAGLSTLVVPFRVQGFGPYAEVLAGLDYRADQAGLLPHPAVTAWIEAEADRMLGARPAILP